MKIIIPKTLNINRIAKTLKRIYRGKVNNNCMAYWSSGSLIQTTSTIPLQWSFIVWTRQGSTQQLFVNGVLDNANTLNSGNIPTCSFGNYLGAIFQGPSSIMGEFYNGKIDDVRFYNRVLTDSEIQQLFNE